MLGPGQVLGPGAGAVPAAGPAPGECHRGSLPALGCRAAVGSGLEGLGGPAHRGRVLARVLRRNDKMIRMGF